MTLEGNSFIPEQVSKRQMRLMLDAIPARIWFLDREHRVRFANREAAALFDLKPSQIVGRSAVSLTGQDSFDRNRPFRDTALSGSVATWEGWSVYPDEEERYTQRTFSPHFDRSDKVDGYYEFVRDITDQKRAESQRNRSLELLNDAIESLSEGFALFDAEDRLVRCNSRFLQLNAPHQGVFGPGVTWLDAARARAEKGFFPDANGQVDAWLEERLRCRKEARDDEIALAGGRWVEISHRRTQQGGLVHTWRDITARKEMERALHESAEMVRRILEACPFALVMARVSDLRILYESSANNVMFGESQKNKAKYIGEYDVDPSQRDEYMKRLKRDGYVNNFEMRFKGLDGREFFSALSGRLIEYDGEEVIVSGAVDLTEIKEAEDELSRQREMLHESEKLSALGELLAGVSHELNNPLSVLVGQALMLEEEASDEKFAARAEMIGKAADRCARIVKSFLAMARQEPTQLEPVDLATIIENALEVTAYSLRSSGIEVSLRMAENLPMVMADPDQMRQVLINLIINARDALQDVAEPRKLRITTSFRQKSQEVVVKVRDNGPGVPPEIGSRIFEPLFTTKEVGSGTGVGLSLCHRIIEAHNGSISTERAPSEGAIFAIRLPPAKKGARVPSSKRPASSKTTECRTLVVEDDSDVGQIIAEVLELDGHSVDLAASGSIALQKIRRRAYDVVLSDVRMPGMDGPSFYRALAKVRPEQLSTLAFITGDTLSQKVREFLDAAERPYLEKPISPEDLRKLVDLLTRRKAI
jgi:PAS domain S-box-containing protein